MDLTGADVNADVGITTTMTNKTEKNMTGLTSRELPGRGMIQYSTDVVHRNHWNSVKFVQCTPPRGDIDAFSTRQTLRSWWTPSDTYELYQQPVGVESVIERLSGLIDEGMLDCGGKLSSSFHGGAVHRL